MNTWLAGAVVLLITLVIMVIPILTDKELTGRRRSAVLLGAVIRVFYVAGFFLCIYLLDIFVRWVRHAVK
jgi:hypothetical protein